MHGRGWGRAMAACALLIGLGCGDDDEEPTSEPPSSPAPEAPAEPTAVPEPSESEALDGHTAPDPRSRDASDRFGTFRESLGEGRRLARSGDQEAAIVAFERALAAADDPVARCELGWAQFRADRVDDAARTLDVVLRGVSDDPARVPEERRRTYGACLYNRGRVAEAQDDPATAARAYRRSLGLRPNATVQARLDALAIEEPAADPDCEHVCEGPFAERAELERGLLGTIAELYEDFERSCGELDRPFAFRLEPWLEGPASGPYLETAVAQVVSGPCYAAPELSLVVAATRSERGWSGCVLGSAWGGVNEVITAMGEPTVPGDLLRLGLMVETFDTEAAGDCNACFIAMEDGEPWEGDEECTEACADYNTEHTFSVDSRLVEGRLQPLECGSLTFE